MQYGYCMVRISVMMFNVTFNNISAKSRIYIYIYIYGGQFNLCRKPDYPWKTCNLL